MKSQSPADKLVKNFRDKGIDFAEEILKRHWKAPALLEMQSEIANLNDNQKAAFRKAVTETIDGALHELVKHFTS